MSRRKQAWPLHLDACERLGSLLEHGICSESGDDGGVEDEHVCGKCRLEFVTLGEFLQHKNVCTRKRLVLLVEDSCDEAEPSSPFSEEPDNMPTIPYITSSPYDRPPYSPDSTGMPALIPARGNQPYTDCDDQLIELDNYAKSENYANSEESFTSENRRASDHISISNPSSLPQYLLMQAVPDTNVTLQALQNTRVAVAQQGIGSNNLSDALHTALYTLQQQQIIQLHQVIQQLQSRIFGSSSSTPNPLIPNSPTVNTLTGSAALTPPQSTDGNNGGVLALTTTAPSLRTLECVTQSQNVSVAVL